MNAVEIARKMKTDAVKFYKEAADRTSHPAGKKMFLSIMEDEVRHIRMIDAIIKGMGLTEDNIDPLENVRTVFEQMKSELEQKLSASSDDTEALKVAMGMEKEGFDFYVKSAAEATDDASRALFERLSKEEDQHFKMFSNTYNFINDTGNWFMWEEKGIIEG